MEKEDIDKLNTNVLYLFYRLASSIPPCINPSVSLVIQQQITWTTISTHGILILHLVSRLTVSRASLYCRRVHISVKGNAEETKSGSKFTGDSRILGETRMFLKPLSTISLCRKVFGNIKLKSFIFSFPSRGIRN